MTRGRETLRIEIEPLEGDDGPNWNEFQYWIFSLVNPAAAAGS